MTRANRAKQRPELAENVFDYSRKSVKNGEPSQLFGPLYLWRFVVLHQIVWRVRTDTIASEASGSLALPAVLTAPIRLDVVQHVHSTLEGIQFVFLILLRCFCRLQRASRKTSGRHTRSAKRPATRRVLSRGVLVVLLLVFPVLVVEAPTAPARFH